MTAAVLAGTLEGLADTVSHVRSSVVQLCTRRRGSGGRVSAAGSGVVWRLTRDGGTLVVSNEHVADEMPITVITPDGDERAATLVARDPQRDLSLMLIAATTPGLVGAAHSRRAPLRAGEFVIAVGHPFGVTNAVSTGVVHAVGPLATVVPVPRAQADLEWVQADVRLGPGSSGGPLVDAAGLVVGINTMIIGGLALAVPIAAVTAFVRVALGQAVSG